MVDRRGLSSETRVSEWAKRKAGEINPSYSNWRQNECGLSLRERDSFSTSIRQKLVFFTKPLPKPSHTLTPNHTPSSSSKFGVSLVSNEALVIVAATEAVKLARAAAKVARDVASVVAHVGEVWSWSGNESNNGLVMRRKKKSGKRLELLDVKEEMNVDNLRYFSTGFVHNEFLNPTEEAE
ncbi:hypothetical protein PanWU01x14_051330 [Parasponia andersonii]|uniref:Uncharacterized protein n=1 Tax=Parasponia andersonii TaxID=3476 RepID=A0A2P5DLY1_PARAD|nr:hypothetical protein PanWU01x14_051330 [Parasponia andersonii]